MEHFWGESYFYVVAALAVTGALLTVLMPNPIRGAMGLLLMIVSLAGLFLALHAQFLAAIQLIVYAGAIVVLFLFVIMLLGPDATPPHDRRGRFSRTVGGGLFVLAAMGAMAAVVHGGLRYAMPAVGTDFGSIDQFGRVLFSYGVVPFELSSALLMVAVLGAVGVARGKDNRNKAKVSGGPLGAATTQPGSEGGAAARFAAASAAHGPGDLVPAEESEMPIPPYVILSAVLFTIGGAGFLVRRNVLVQLMSIEIMLNAVNLALVAFNRSLPSNLNGQMFAFFLIAAEAAEVAVGLAIVLSLFRIKRTVRSDDADLLKN